MDGNEFDAQARSLADRGTRRGLLRTGLVLAGAALGLRNGAGVDAATGRRQVGSPCVTNSNCITGVCGPAGVRWKECQCVSASDCPAPANPCAVAACVSGACGEAPRNAGTVCRPATDACSAATTCTGQSTICPAGVAACAIGETCCGTTCVDVQSDEANCGSCGSTCAGGETCCGGACVDVQGVEANCGGCGITCAAGSTCCGGTCGAVVNNPVISVSFSPTSSSTFCSPIVSVTGFAGCTAYTAEFWSARSSDGTNNPQRAVDLPLTTTDVNGASQTTAGSFFNQNRWIEFRVTLPSGQVRSGWRQVTCPA